MPRMSTVSAPTSEPVTPGRIYVAPGDFHMTVTVEGGRKVLHLDKNPPENFCRPAVDVLFRSVAASHGAAALAVVMTGMGQDGLKGCEQLVAAGADVFASNALAARRNRSRRASTSWTGS